MPRNSRKSMNDPNPLYALAGAGDLAVEKIREFSKLASDKIGSLESTDPAVMSDRVQERIEERADAIAVALRRHSTDIRIQAKDLGEKAQSMVQSALVQAGDTYETLAVRGKDAVVRIRSTQNGGSRPSRQISRTGGGSSSSTPRAKSTTTRKRAATKKSGSATKTSRTPATAGSRKATRSADSGTKSATTAKASSSSKSGSAAKPASTAKPTVTATPATTPPMDAGLPTSSTSASPTTTGQATANPTTASSTASGAATGSSSTTKKGGSAKPTS